MWADEIDAEGYLAKSFHQLDELLEVVRWHMR